MWTVFHAVLISWIVRITFKIESSCIRKQRLLTTYLRLCLPVTCLGCVIAVQADVDSLRCYIGLKPTRPEGACLQMVSLGGASVFCLGDSILISRIWGIFPLRWEADVSLFLSRHTDPVSVSFPRPVKPGPPPPPRDRGGTWAPWEGWPSVSAVTWRRSAFCGRHCFRCSAVSTWSRSNSSQLSHGKTQTRFDLNVMFWWFPLKMDSHSRVCLSKWSPGIGLNVTIVDVRCDLWLLAGRGFTEIRLETQDHSHSSSCFACRAEVLIVNP